MPSLLDTTIGGASSNSWASLVEQKTYASIRTPSIPWIDDATDTEIEQKMILSCLLVNNAFDWTGEAASETQRLAWPRIGMKSRNGHPISSAVIPVDLINAQCEMTLLLGASDLLGENQADKQGVKRVKAGSVEVEFQEKDMSSYEGMDAAISRLGAAFNYLAIPISVRMLLVPSWYREGIVTPRRRVRFRTL